MKRTHFSELSILKFSRYIRKAVVTKMKTPKTKTQDPLQKRRPFAKTKTPTKTKTHYKNEDPQRKRRPITKTKTPYQNKDTLLKQVQKRLLLPLWTKIMFISIALTHFEVNIFFKKKEKLVGPRGLINLSPLGPTTYHLAS